MDSPDRIFFMPLTPSDSQLFMAAALVEARKAEQQGEVPAGALIVDPSGQIITRAHNQVIGLCDPTAHAEILAIRQAAEILGNYRLTGLTLVSTLEPCPMCLMAAIHARLAKVCYGAPVPKWGAAGSLLDLQNLSGFNHRLAIEGLILAEPCAELIKCFFQKRRADIN